MQWLKLTYNGNLQEYIENNRKLMMAMGIVNIVVPSELLSFTLLGKLLGDSEVHQYVETLLLNEELIELPDLILLKLQDFHNNSTMQETITDTPASALFSELTHPYKILYYCTNGKHNPMCTSHTKQECFVENPHLRPPCQNNKQQAQNNQNISAHLSPAQALVTRNNAASSSSDLIVDCGATHHIFNSKEPFSLPVASPSLKVCIGDTASTLLTKGIGMVTITCDNKVLSLKNCLYVPNLNFNLISLLGLGYERVSITQNKDTFILSSGEETILKGKIMNNLMKINYSTPKTFITQNSNLWHLCLGHPGNQAIKSMGLPDITTKCLTCAKSKIHLLPFKDQFEQHNGFAERANQTILEKACCLLNGSNLTNSYSAEAVNTTTLLSNLVPTPSRLNCSPYNLWRGSPPQIKKLRVFGCRAIIAVPKKHREWKLNPSGAEGVLLGYTNDNTTYWVL
ncbi:hypothetical protein O181_080894 [Austropuccinia psidii MF-1]|uniref:Retrovirus-related Pol polyprotein from transposon TNT 1-94-like beta-barrel domain-containing protein n=1 Tax=Austropuccinia psidii MF-1 TaxID=1389203 RepID=A0A9Q3IJL1_9BASI|nr:hypothetical protein [Austropuccinia psidii MF-1]